MPGLTDGRIRGSSATAARGPARPSLVPRRKPLAAVAVAGLLGWGAAPALATDDAETSSAASTSAKAHVATANGSLGEAATSYARVRRPTTASVPVPWAWALAVNDPVPTFRVVPVDASATSWRAARVAGGRAFACTLEHLIDDRPCAVDGDPGLQGRGVPAAVDEARTFDAIVDQMCRGRAETSDRRLQTEAALDHCRDAGQRARDACLSATAGDAQAPAIVDDDGRFLRDAAGCFVALRESLAFGPFGREAFAGCCACAAQAATCRTPANVCAARLDAGVAPPDAACLERACPQACRGLSHLQHAPASTEEVTP